MNRKRSEPIVTYINRPTFTPSDTQREINAWNSAVDACIKAIECSCSCAGRAQLEMEKLKRRSDGP